MDDRLVSYLYYFNIERNYYECHEYAEHLWFDTGRPKILKGLIQAAVCLYHLNHGNVKGAWTMWNRARTYLEAGPENYNGIDTANLITDIDAVFAQVPIEWRGKRVPEAQIGQLNLPIVTVQVDDPSITLSLPHWSPPALPELPEDVLHKRT